MLRTTSSSLSVLPGAEHVLFRWNSFRFLRARAPAPPVHCPPPSPRSWLVDRLLKEDPCGVIIHSFRSRMWGILKGFIQSPEPRHGFIHRPLFSHSQPSSNLWNLFSKYFLFNVHQSLPVRQVEWVCPRPGTVSTLHSDNLSGKSF